MQILYSKIIGEGSPLLILHGFLGMSDNWKTLGGQYAEKGFQVHLIDQRNHGKSFWSTEFDYDILAEDLKNYMQHHDLVKAGIIGHSMGGKTAMQFACTHPDLVNKLIVADIAPKYYPPHHDYILDALNALDFSTIASRSDAELQLSQHLTAQGIRQFLLKNLFWKEKNQLAFRFNLEVLSERMEEIGENIGATETFNGPCLFLRGEQSEYVVIADYPEIKKHFPNAEIQTIDRAGHWLHAENPKQFFDKSIQFLNT
ncbi:alpha/beta fold hydrolase [Costertonia aggregata]|uniref:Alpha/beta fold hydrolase n=1 Tax=Costertonia aggregata TaxID=343403 RepID=A0A7H9AM95_9FLAO|nr:alpha/beta fold hydrolase [Costertonia aggregata]QLG44493.1 alpha/beta fold hydrolase [Costertonia aggregata]